MTRLERKVFANTALTGLLLTLTVMGADQLGLLASLERWLFDERVARCQFFMPPPTDRLVHLDIDDAALESIGRWPWDRGIMAEVMDEVALASPAAVGLDVMFPEPQEPEWVKQADGTFSRVDHDALFAESLQKLGTALVPASFSFPTEAPSAVFTAVREVLVEDLEAVEAHIVEALRAKGFDGAGLPEQVEAEFLGARREAMYARIERELRQEDVSPETLRQRVLPGTRAGIVSPLTRLFSVQYQRALAAVELRQFGRPLLPGVSPPLFRSSLAIAPIVPLIRAAGSTGFVDYPQSVDGRVRSVPLFIEAEGRMYPQMGLSLACAAMKVRLTEVALTSNTVSIPRPGKPTLVIPVRTLPSRHLDRITRDVPLATDLPWFGTSDWMSMYGGHKKQHLPISKVSGACQSRRQIKVNNAQADAALRSSYAAMGDEAKVKWFEAHPLPPDDWKSRFDLVKAAVDDLEPFIPQAEPPAGEASPAAFADLTPEEQILIESYKALREYLAQAPLLTAQLEADRKLLSDTMKDKAVLVGWTATGAIADFIPTSLHAKCPGVVLHGVLFNAIMTGEAWRNLPAWITLLVTFTIGLLATAAVAYLPPGKALISSLLIVAIFMLVNGVLLFDYANIILGAAGPLAAVGLVWSGGTLTRLFLEQQQRALIRRRFRTYVDPRLVDFVERHPELAGFEGERREMTVVFTDLVGFTKLTEAMGEDTVKLLNQLWARMVPVVRRNGLLNKFLGDGIMFFYGAPEPTTDHAARAIDAVLEMNEVMHQFGREVTAPRGLPALGMRFGMSTGDMIVGDAGAGEAGSDYTVLGDNVNLASRLEGANKATGTSNLMTARTVELADNQFLVRPVGKLRVKGKTQAVETFEALCRIEEATEADKRLAQVTTEMVTAYQARRLEECIALSETLLGLSEKKELPTIYRDLAQHHLTHPADEPFDGAITLTEK